MIPSPPAPSSAELPAARPLSDNEVGIGERSDLSRLNWRGVDLAIGIATIIGWRLTAGLMGNSTSNIPTAVHIVVGLMLPMLFVFAYPLWAYRRAGGKWQIRWPTPATIAIEVVCAALTVMTLLSALVLLSQMVTRFSGGPPEIDPGMRNIVDSANPALFALFATLACVWAPIAEELYFRGFLQNALGRWLPVWLAAVLQTLGFAFAHHYAGVHFVAILIVGFGLTLHYLWRRSLLASSLVHCGFNTFMTAMLGTWMMLQANAPVLGVEGDADADNCRIAHVLADSPAERAGLRVGDVVVTINDRPVDSFQTLRMLLWSHQAGEEVTLQLERGTQRITTTVTLAARDEVTSPTLPNPDGSH
ncbi:MAG: PDZ domain-containing protein [Planctomycetaceae bacterium]